MAKSQGLKSTADLAAAKFVSSVEPVRKLSAAERHVWDRVMVSWPKDRWIVSDAEILTQYCAACVAFEVSRKADNLPAMDRAGRLSLLYATKLRLTPLSRYDYKGTQVQAEKGRDNEAAADRLLGGVDEWPDQQDSSVN